MKKNFFTLPFLVSLFLLNSGFIFKPKLRAFYCGDYSQLVKSNQELLRQQEEIFIFDNKGKSYQYDYSYDLVYPDQLKVVSGVKFKREKSYIKGSKFYIDYKVTYNSIVGSAEMILDFDKKNITGLINMNGTNQALPKSNCKEIEFPKGTKFEY